MSLTTPLAFIFTRNLYSIVVVIVYFKSVYLSFRSNNGAALLFLSYQRTDIDDGRTTVRVFYLFQHFFSYFLFLRYSWLVWCSSSQVLFSFVSIVFQASFVNCIFFFFFKLSALYDRFVSVFFISFLGIRYRFMVIIIIMECTYTYKPITIRYKRNLLFLFRMWENWGVFFVDYLLWWSRWVVLMGK